MQSIHNALKVFVPLLTFLLLYSSLNAGTKYARQNGDWDDVNTWSTIGVGGASCSCVPDNVDSVVIDKYKINVLNANDTVTSLLLTNLSGSNAELKISSAYGLVITSNFWAIAEDVDKDVTILIEDDNSYLKVLGNTVFTRTADNNRKKKLRLKMEDDGTMMYVSGNFTFNYLNAKSDENNKEIELSDSSVLKVDGDMYCRMDAGKKFIIRITDKSQVYVGGDFTMDMNGGDDTEIDFDDFTYLDVDGNCYFYLDGGDDMKVKFGDGGGSASLVVDGNLVMEHNSGDDIFLQFKDFTTLTVDGVITLDYNDASTNQLYILLKDDTKIIAKSDVNLAGLADGTVYIQIEDDSEIGISGDFVRAASPNNYGALTCKHNSLVTFEGPAAQIIAEDAGAGVDDFEYMNVTINNTFGTSPQLTLEGDVSIEGTLTMTDGVVELGTFDLTINNDGTTAGGSIASYIDATASNGGVMIKNFDATGTINYPVGDDDEYSPFTFTLNSAGYGGSDFVSLNVTDAKEPNMGDGDFITRYWSMNAGGFNSIDYDVSYVYTDADISGTEVNMETAKWDGSDWWIYQSVNAGTNTLFSTMGITTIPAGHNFTGGSPGALPIELTSFEATALIDKVQVIWSTASEINNEYFQLERSKNGTGFDIINRVAGAGNSFTETEYSYIDLNPHKGTSYYRLLQVDFNGDSKMYGPISVEIENNTDPGLYLFPNPSNGATLNLQLSNIDASEEPIEVRIFDQLGKKVYTYKIDTEFETIISMICFEETLSAGIYSVIATSPGMTLTQKLIVQ